MRALPLRVGSHPRRNALLLTATVTTALAVATPATAGTTSTPGAAAPGASRWVTLVTGDEVRVTTGPDGRQLASVVQRASSGPGSQFETFNLGPDLYVVPESAVPYLGSTLDLSLFDVTALAASGTANTRVHVTYRTPVAARTVPGITRIQQRSGTTAQGVVTRASGSQFGAALARQWRADHASPTHTTGLFASVARIAAAAPVMSSTPSASGLHFSTLTINGINESGDADSGDSALIFNVDDLNTYANSATFQDGVAKVSVPNGHYAAMSAFVDSTGTVREVITPQFTVAGGRTAITLDARDATTAVSVTTQKPATPQINRTVIGRADALGQIGTFAFFGGGTTSFDIEPTTRKITIGDLHYYYFTHQAAADGSYTYDLEFPTDGAIPASQHYAPTDSELAAVDAKYSASHAGTRGMTELSTLLPWERAANSLFAPITAPIERTEFYSALPDLSFQSGWFTVSPFGQSGPVGHYRQAWRTYQPGTTLTTSWGDTPAGPRLLEAPVLDNTMTTVCPACINGTTLDLLAFPYGDSSPQHGGVATTNGLGQLAPGQSISSSVFADDALVAQGSVLQTSVTMPSAAQTYRIDYETDRSSPDFLLSTAVHTGWSVPAAVPTGALPGGWVCSQGGSTDCRVVPLITNSYHLPVNLLGQLPSGSTTGQLDLGHLGGQSIDFGSVQVNMSFDSGQSWQPVTVTDLGSGHFGLAFTVPAAADSDGFGALQVAVHDAVGGTFDQTIQHAFAIGS